MFIHWNLLRLCTFLLWGEKRQNHYVDEKQHNFGKSSNFARWFPDAKTVAHSYPLPFPSLPFSKLYIRP